MAQQNDDPPNAGLQDNCKKLTQLRVEKLRKEEEEEQWISGEELYTEGSSDEDLADPRARRRITEDHGVKLPPRRRGHKCTSPRNRKKQLDPSPAPSEASGATCAKNSLLPAVTISSQLSDSETPPDQSVSPAVESEEEVEISWRPKRGSIKLPELSTEGRLVELAANTQM